MSTLPKGRPTSCFVDLEALRWNFRQVRATVGPKVKILSVVKADGYGHGARAVAETLAEEGSEVFGVATVEEGIELRQSGLRLPILVLAGFYPGQVDEIIHHKLTPTVCDLDGLRLLEKEAGKRKVTVECHLKLDTGMGRIGFLPVNFDAWVPELAKIQAVKLVGLFSHFSHAERVDGEYTRKQLEVFQSVVERLEEKKLRPPLLHLANSAAVITLPSAYFNMVRPGIMLYGAYPSASMAGQISLKPVLSWKTRILQIKRVPKHTSISYGQTFVTKRESVIGTLPVGYADGYFRLLSNRGSVLVRRKRAPIAGRVCMDLTMIDVTDIGGVQQGDEVVLLGSQGDAVISADEMAEWSKTISYEILTSISARVPRIYYSSKEGR